MCGHREGGCGVPVVAWGYRRICVAGLALVLVPVAGAAQSAYRFGPPAEWIKPLPLPSAAAKADTAGGSTYEILLLDEQHAVQAGSVDRYRHIAYRVLNEEGVQDHSQIPLTVDSSFQ